MNQPKHVFLSPMLSEQLKSQTENSHRLLEKKIIKRIKSVNTLEDYALILQLFYSYFGGLEKLVDRTIDRIMLPDYPDRRKTASLALDLTDLSAGIPLLATGTDLPPIQNNLQAFGGLYVMEGSVLGGPFITKMIRQRLSLSDEKGFSFFSGYGSNTAAMWQSFKTVTDEQLSVNANTDNIVILSAIDTFEYFGNWIDKH